MQTGKYKNIENRSTKVTVYWLEIFKTLNISLSTQTAVIKKSFLIASIRLINSTLIINTFIVGMLIIGVFDRKKRIKNLGENKDVKKSVAISK